MSYSTCLVDAITAGAVKGDLLKGLYADLDAYRKKAQREGLSGAEIEEFAVKNALMQTTIKKQRSKHQQSLQVTAQARTLDIISRNDGGKDVGIMSLLDRDLRVHNGKTPHANVHNRANTIEGMAQGRFSEGLQALHTTHLGLKQNRKTLTDTVKELFGESTGNVSAAKAAKGFADSAEWQRQRFNRAGGFIGKLDNWGMPQSHKLSRVRKVSMETWIEFTKDLLSDTKMTDEFDVPLTDASLQAGLESTYRNIITNGRSAANAGNMGKGKLANQHQDSRFLIFKDADSWIKYQEKFGEPDIFSTMTGHIRHMSNEIAMLEVLGPNPEHTYRYLKNMASADGAGIFSIGTLDGTYNVVSGRADAIAEGKFAERLAATTGFVRHGLVAAQLGGAFISSIGDVVLAKMTRAYNGIPANRMAKELISQLDPTNEADRQFAAHQGLAASGWTRRAVASARFAGETDSGAVGQKLSEAVMRASFIQTWTDAGRSSFGLDFQWHLGRQTDKPLGEIEDRFQATLRRYGVDDASWETIRKAPLEEHNGTSYFRPDNIRQIEGVSPSDADELASRILDAINTETDIAVLTPSARDRAIMTSGRERGTVMGEVARAGTMYKGFSIAMWNAHIMRAVTKDWNGKQDFGYLIRLVTGLTLMGGLAIQLKDIAKGKKPRDWDSPDFFFAAMSQGGGLGIFGDFLYTGFTGKSRHGDNLATTMSGPMIGFASDSAELVFSGVAGVTFAGDETNLGREFSKYFKSYTPGNSLWQTRLISERMLFDQLQRLADPKAKSSWKRTEKRMVKEKNQRYWWKRGETSPSF